MKMTFMYDIVVNSINYENIDGIVVLDRVE